MTPLRMATGSATAKATRRAGRELSATRTPDRNTPRMKFTDHLDLEGIKPSIGSVGDAYDTQSIMGRGWQVVSLTRATTGGHG